MAAAVGAEVPAVVTRQIKVGVRVNTEVRGKHERVGTGTTRKSIDARAA